MGYTSTGLSRKGLVSRLTAGWSRDFETPREDGAVRSEQKCLAHCWRGNVTHKGRLWAVWESRQLDAAGNVVRSDRWITLDLCDYKNDGEGWGYRDQCESSGPYEYDCPLRYLEMVPTSPEPHGPPWREKVRAAAAEKARRRKLIREAKEGDVIRIIDGLVTADKFRTPLPTRLRVIRAAKGKRLRLGAYCGGWGEYAILPRHILENLGPDASLEPEPAEAVTA